jgi:PBP1b-binding outer membrane lipoprotein LpoB
MKKILLLTVALGLGLFMAGCEEKTPEEQLKETMEKQAEIIKEAVSEKAEEVEKALQE